MNHIYSSISTPETCRLRRLSKPSPPERDQLKKPNTMTSPNFLVQNINPMDSSNQVHIPSAGAYNLPPPTIQPTTFALLPSDLSNIVQQLRTILREEISQSIKCLLQDEIQSSIKDAFSTMQNDIQQLKLENSKLRADVDALEQYGRRELVRFSGIVEKGGENTTDIVTEIIKSVDSEFANGDIIRSHRVGKLNKNHPKITVLLSQDKLLFV